MFLSAAAGVFRGSPFFLLFRLLLCFFRGFGLVAFFLAGFTLGVLAICLCEFEVKDMPVTVAVDVNGSSVHQTGPKEWQAKIGKIPVVMA